MKFLSLDVTVEDSPANNEIYLIVFVGLVVSFASANEPINISLLFGE